MTHHFSENKLLPYDMEELFELVLDVENYPTFLPWIDEIKIISKQENEIIADMYVKVLSLKQNYRSKINYTIDENKALIEVKAIDGIFNHLDNIWKFAKDEKGTIIDFSVDFEFKSKVLDSIAGPIFKNIAHQMMHAFEKKIKEKHGKY